ncbi:MAG: GerMN domain-containing protein [Candidatus Gastranaerophilales bacterium]|nr:GerMN domain-containing protein [Candidatus Gastranaerophilales bacterium]
MNTFFKTFFACLILTLSFLAYKFVSVDSYSADLNVSKNNPVFGLHENLPEAKPVETTKLIEKEVIKTEVQEKQTPKKQEKYEHNCYFYSASGQLVLAKRDLSFKPSLENSISVLLKGPLISETKKGIYSEIPANVDLISVRRLDKDVIIDLSSNFGNGGGTNSIANRVKQLSKTVKLHEPNKNIYLYINGKEVEYVGGDGVYIKQPLD